MGKKTGPNISQNAHDLARKEKIDVGEIKGTGSGNQITVTDVKAYIDNGKKPVTAAATKEPAKAGTDDQAPAAPADPPVDDAGTQVQPPAPTQVAATPPVVEPLPSVVPYDELAEGRRDITRVNVVTGAWWCPFCDRSMESTLPDCGGCGAVREGQEAVR